jgi:hypothetical protein
MARAFDVNAARSTFNLPPLTRQQIQALMLDLDATALDVIVMAVAQLWQREIGTPDRDLAAEIDELKQQVAALQPH